MPSLEQQVRTKILTQYPNVWEVEFSYDEGVVIELNARPNAAPPCLVALSRLVASVYASSGYTILIHFLWKPVRFQVLFGPRAI